MNFIKLLFLTLAFTTTLSVMAQETWRGLVVAPEDRCSPYDKKAQYPYPQSVEDTIVDRMGGRIYGPYSGRYFKSDYETDIEHILAVSEGHDSGLCRASKQKRIEFATDQLNLTLASPKVNRCGRGGKCGFDAADWMPEKNKCWFANRIVEIKTKYELTVNRSEANALESTLAQCDSFEMVFTDGAATGKSTIGQSIINFKARTIARVKDKLQPTSALEKYDDNGNGRITCAEARSHGIAPVKKADPAYPFMKDGNNDGVVCE
jgi:hypothetical protein